MDLFHRVGSIKIRSQLSEHILLQFSEFPCLQVDGMQPITIQDWISLFSQPKRCPPEAIYSSSSSYCFGYFSFPHDGNFVNLFTKPNWNSSKPNQHLSECIFQFFPFVSSFQTQVGLLKVLFTTTNHFLVCHNTVDTSSNIISLLTHGICEIFGP